jgi:carotenoid cleavage dioxygenase-like enzyme
MRVSLPALETVGWFNGIRAEGEIATQESSGPVFGGSDLLSFFKEWTTGHPRVDPITHELVLFHSASVSPYVFYSVIPPDASRSTSRPLISEPIPGFTSAKLMHDFGVSSTHTIILALPLSLKPANLARGLPVITYDESLTSRFGVFPRHDPSAIRWFETKKCYIFHTANCWDVVSPANPSKVTVVNMLACRLISASLVFGAGNMPLPLPNVASPLEIEEEQSRLYYYAFDLATQAITHQWALSIIPFEFPTVRHDKQMTDARYIYGCSLTHGTFSAALGGSVKVDSIAKVDAHNLITRGQASPPISIIGSVDNRPMAEILLSTDTEDPIKVLKLPDGFCGQECSFVAKRNGESEDDGWIVFYVFDESQLGMDGEAGLGAMSELWIVDAKSMKEVVCKVNLPQRVPYGLHGKWFPEEEIMGQRPVERFRKMSVLTKGWEGKGLLMNLWMRSRKWILEAVG